MLLGLRPGGLATMRRLQLLLLLFRHSAESLNAQDERLAIEARLHVRKNNVDILTPETAGTVGV